MTSRFCLILAALTVLVAVTSGLKEFGEVVAATSTQRDTNLILFTSAGNVLSAVTGEPVPFFPAPSDFTMTAATCHFGSMLFSCTYYGHNEIKRNGMLLTREANSDMFPDFVWSGLDAVVDTFGNDYYLKGCEYIVRDSWGHFHLTPENLSDLEVPCHVDAAWDDRRGPVVLKGSQVWRVDNDINAPQDFDEYVSEMFG